MAVKRKGFESLSRNYQRRLLGKGITAEAYDKGADIRGARGHAATPEHGGYKKKALLSDIESVFEDFGELSRAEQELIGQSWVDGFMSRSKGPVKNPRRKKGERIRRSASDEQIRARMAFMRWMDEYEGGFATEDWKVFREAYNAKFTA